MIYITSTLRGRTEIVISGVTPEDAAYFLARFRVVNPLHTYAAWMRG